MISFDLWFFTLITKHLSIKNLIFLTLNLILLWWSELKILDGMGTGRKKGNGEEREKIKTKHPYKWCVGKGLIKHKDSIIMGFEKQGKIIYKRGGPKWPTVWP